MTVKLGQLAKGASQTFTSVWASTDTQATDTQGCWASQALQALPIFSPGTQEFKV